MAAFNYWLNAWQQVITNRPKDQKVFEAFEERLPALMESLFQGCTPQEKRAVDLELANFYLRLPNQEHLAIKCFPLRGNEALNENDTRYQEVRKNIFEKIS